MRRMPFRVRVVGLVFVWLAFATAQAATITVNSVLDSVTPNDGNVTLREAITAIMAGNDLGDPNITAQGPFTGANAFGASDTINFNIAGAGVHTLTPASGYPSITKPVTINGYSQTGSTVNTLAVGDNANLVIEINGTGVPANTSLFALTGSGGSTVRGLVINRLSAVAFNIGVGVNSINNKIAGNFVGTDTTGSTFMGTSSNPVEIRGTGNIIGGTTPADRNVIVGGACCNAGTIVIVNGGGNTIQGNYIGVNAAGTAPLQPSGSTDAIELLAAPNNTIGGSAAGAGNVILGTRIGIRLGAGASNNNVIQGNFIGTNAAGTATLGVAGDGISTDNGASFNVIGGSGAGAGNVISGGNHGIIIADGATTYTIQGNKIGTDASGTGIIGNFATGVSVFTPSNGSLIGGTSPGQGNIIAGSVSVGVYVGGGTGWSILGNSIYSNGGIGISLDMGSSALPNDVGDPDTGPNNWQNYPVLTAASVSGGNVLVSGTLNSLANRTFRLEFFSNTACDESGNGEGQTFLGSSNVTTNGAGNASFNNLSFPAAGGNVITSTATLIPTVGAVTQPMAVQPRGLATPAFSDTSEFSACLAMAVPPPTIGKAFGATTVPLNASTALTFTITNQAVGNAALTGVAFTDTLPAGLVVANPNGLNGTCGSGTVTATAGTGSVSLAGGTLAAGGTCTFSVNVTGTTAGLKNNSVSVTSTEGGAGNTANASVTVVPPPTIGKAFGATTVPLNASTLLTFTITNQAAGNAALTGVVFTDTLPAGLVVANPNGLNGTCGSGTVTATAGTGSVSLAGGTLAAGGTCTFSVNVTGTTVGLKNNSVSVTSTEGGAGNTANANVTVVSPPTIGKAFGVTTLAVNGSTTLTFTITNPAANTVALTGVAFTDTLPAGVVVSTPNGLTGSCGGTVTAVAGSGAVSLTGGTVATNSACTIVVNVNGTTAGVKDNVTGAVSSTNGGTGNTASASVTVATSLTIAKAFGVMTMPLNGSTGLTFTITNPNASLALTGVAFTDTLPSGLVVATPNGLNGTCGSGTITATAGTGTVSLTGGTLAASGTCTFSVNITGTTAGLKSNSVTVSSTQTGAGNTSNANVTVVAAPTIGKQFASGVLSVGGVTTLTFNLTNPNTTTALTGVGFTDTLPAGLVVSTPNGLSGSCGSGAITAAAGSSSVSLTGGTLAASGACSFAVNVTATGAGAQNNVTGAVTSNEGGGGTTASASVVVGVPPTAVIPTLSTWMLMLLGLLLSITAWFVRRRSKRGN